MMPEPSPEHALEIPSARPPSPWPKRLILGGLLLAGAGAAAWALRPAEQVQTPRFRTAPVKTQEIVQTVESTGVLRPRAPVSVTAGVQGRLVEVAVRPRQQVQADALLARLDAAPLRLDERRAQASLSAAASAIQRARAAAGLSEDNLRRLSRLAKAGQASHSALQAAKSEAAASAAAVKLAQARWREAKASTELATFAREKVELRAPKAGVVLQVPEQLGLTVSPAGPQLFTIAEPLSELELVASVAEADIGRIKVGQPASFEVQAYPGRRFSAKVGAIGVLAAIQRNITTYPVTLTAANKDGALLPGMTTEVRFEVARVAQALAVRDAALRFRPADEQAPPRSLVYVVDDDQLRRVPVEVGVTDGVWTQVKGALKPGDEVAVGFLSTETAQRPGLKISG